MLSVEGRRELRGLVEDAVLAKLKTAASSPKERAKPEFIAWLTKFAYGLHAIASDMSLEGGGLDWPELDRAIDLLGDTRYLPSKAPKKVMDQAVLALLMAIENLGALMAEMKGHAEWTQHAASVAGVA